MALFHISKLSCKNSQRRSNISNLLCHCSTLSRSLFYVTCNHLYFHTPSEPPLFKGGSRAMQQIRATYYQYKSTLISNGLSKSFSITCFVSFSERLACSVGIFQSIPRLSSRIEIPPSASG